MVKLYIEIYALDYNRIFLYYISKGIARRQIKNVENLLPYVMVHADIENIEVFL